MGGAVVFRYKRGNIFLVLLLRSGDKGLYSLSHAVGGLKRV